jgi:hypothetical protein
MADPTVLTITTASTPLATNRSYNYVGYFDGASSSAGAKFVSAEVKKKISDSTGVTQPWAQTPMKFRV